LTDYRVSVMSQDLVPSVTTYENDVYVSNGGYSFTKFVIVPGFRYPLILFFILSSNTVHKTYDEDINQINNNDFYFPAQIWGLNYGLFPSPPYLQYGRFAYHVFANMKM